MSKRVVEIFTAGCPCCEEAVQAIRAAACPSCDVRIQDVRGDANARARAKQYGVHRVPAVAIDGRLADCCASGPVDLDRLRALGLGAP